MAMRMGGVLAVAVLLAACKGGDGKGAAPRAADGGIAAPAAAGASPGAALYGRACVMCHGERGVGTAIGPALNDRRRELAEVVHAVEAGAPAAAEHHTPMPPRGDGAFTDQDVRTVAEYVRSLAR